MDSYGRVNARVTLSLNEDSWHVSASINNAAGTDYLVDRRLNPFNFAAGAWGNLVSLVLASNLTGFNKVI